MTSPVFAQALARRRGKTNASHLACAQLALGVGPEMRRGRVIDSNPGRGRGGKRRKKSKTNAQEARVSRNELLVMSPRYHVPFFF